MIVLAIVAIALMFMFHNTHKSLEDLKRNYPK